jgi:GT2 family glycosyltransferase
MVYTGIAIFPTDTLPIVSWIQKNPGCSVVFTSDSLSNDLDYLHSITDTWRPKKAVSIVICTYGRPESLNETLLSLTHQSYRNFEVILITEKGHLSELRDKGLRSANGDIVCFIDDDVCCPPAWLQGTVESFREGVVGVTGPTWITQEYRQNRDIFKYQALRRLNDWAFGVSAKPGHLSKTGAPSMESNWESCKYEGPVQYLECCNMSVKRQEALDAGGFDPIYIRTSEWCELDLSLRLSKKGQLIFSQSAALYHRPSKAGVYKARLQTNHRWKNFITFQKKWIKPSLRTFIYRGFIWTYLKMKDLRMI